MADKTGLTGLAYLQNLYNKRVGNNYVMDDGRTTGGIGNYATYTGTDVVPVGLSREAYASFGDNIPKGLSINETPSWLTQNKDTISAGAEGLKALSGLANAYIGYKNYGLAKDTFNFEKAAANANYINAAKDYNTQLQNASDVGLALAGSSVTPEQRAARQAYTDSRRVSESAIG